MLKLFKKEKENNPIYEHEVLRTLRRFGMTITQTGNDTDGYEPFDKFQINTAFLNYGTLVDLMFHPDKYKGQLAMLQNVKTKRHDVDIDRETWNKVAQAIEILEINGDIIDKTDSGFLDISKRTIHLTPKGLKSFNTDFYIKEYKKEYYQDELHKSQIRTNRLMILFTGAIVACTIITLFFQTIQNSQEKSRMNIRIDTLQQEQANTTDSIQSFRKEINSIRKLVDSLKTKDTVKIVFPNK